MSFSRNEVVLVPIPFTDLTSRKVRPAVVVGRNSKASDLFVVPITSQLHNADTALQHWRSAGLNVACGIKGQIATIEERLAVRVVGTLSPADREMLNQRLRLWLEI